MVITVDKTAFVALIGRKDAAISVTHTYAASVVGSSPDSATIQNFRVAAIGGATLGGPALTHVYAASVVGAIPDMATIQNFRVAAIGGATFGGITLSQMRMSAVTSGGVRRKSTIRVITSAT